MAEGYGGVCRGEGHAWQILRDTVNERAVRILLECILFTFKFSSKLHIFSVFREKKISIQILIV